MAPCPAAVFTFETPRQALVAEEVLRRARIDLDEVPPPREIEAAGCDLALRIPLSELYAAIGALATDNAEWQAVYQLGEQQEVVAKLG
jgi:hypothetical protein